MDEQKGHAMSDADKARRDFLRKSVYAACATPVIMSLLVEKANAAQSWNPGLGTRPGNNFKDDDRNLGGQGGPKPGRWNTNIPPGQDQDR
jgi:hypothetical protein